jgi:hypothetical protein
MKSIKITEGYNMGMTAGWILYALLAQFVLTCFDKQSIKSLIGILHLVLLTTVSLGFYRNISLYATQDDFAEELIEKNINKTAD